MLKKTNFTFHYMLIIAYQAARINISLPLPKF
jgi:hypothetical protein